VTIEEAFSLNPFSGVNRRSRDVIIGEPDITTEMAIRFVMACDRYQFRLFAPLILLGLRMSELVFLFRQQIKRGWLVIQRHPKLLYSPKSNGSREAPLLPILERILLHRPQSDESAFVFRRKRAASTPSWAATKRTIIVEFNSRCSCASAATMETRIKIRDEMMREAGALTPRAIESQFRQVHKLLGWPPEATLHKYRHLFQSTMHNAGVPEKDCQLLLGHARGNSVTNCYTHVSRQDLRTHYENAIAKRWSLLLATVEKRAIELGFIEQDCRTGDRILGGPDAFARSNMNSMS